MSESLGRMVEQSEHKTVYLYGEDTDFPFYICKKQCAQVGGAVPDHRHGDMIEIAYLYKGMLKYNIDNVVYDIRSNHVLVAFPGKPHGTYGYNLDQHVMYILQFDPERFVNANFAFGEDECRYIIDSLGNISSCVFVGASSLHGCFENLFQTVSSSSRIGNTLARNRFLTVVTEVIKFAYMNNDNESIEIANALRYIDEHIYENIPLADLARHTLLSESRFKVKFRETTGLPPHEYIVRKKIEVAKQMLRDPNSSVTDVCYQLSFSSSQYFATVFKRLTLLSPSQYKLQFQ